MSAFALATRPVCPTSPIIPEQGVRNLELSSAGHSRLRSRIQNCLGHEKSDRPWRCSRRVAFERDSREGWVTSPDLPMSVFEYSEDVSRWNALHLDVNDGGGVRLYVLH